MNDSRPEWWRPIWISLAGEQPLPNILPALAHGPERVVFLHSDWEASHAPARRCARFLAARGISSQVVKTDPLDPLAVQADVVAIADRLGYGQLLLNWTGGTKVMALAALRAMPPHVPNIYYDSRRGLLVNERPPYTTLPIPPTGPLTLEDHLVLNADVSVAAREISLPASTASGRILEEAADADRRIVFDLMKYRDRVLSKVKVRKGWGSVPGTGLPAPLDGGKFAARSAALIQAMAEDGLLASAAPFRPKAEGLDFLEGFWFEEFVARKVGSALGELGESAAGDGVRRNLVIEWRGRRARNEIDVAFVRGERLYLVSCTTASQSEAAKRLVAVEEFADRLGGRFARAMLASTLPEEDLAVLRSRSRPTSLVPSLGAWRRPRALLEEWFRK